jgi:THO complex subunit 3
VGWSPDGNHVATGDKDDRISIIDARTWKVRHVEPFKTEANEFVWDPTGNYFFVATGNGQIPIFKFPEMKQVLSLKAGSFQSCQVSIKMDPQMKHFAVGGGDALISIWDLRHLTCLRTIDRLDWPVRAVSLSWDGRLLAAGSEDHCIDISWVETGERVWELKCDGASYTLAFHPRLYLLAFSCEERASSSGYSSHRDGVNVKLFGLSPDQI